MLTLEESSEFLWNALVDSLYTATPVNLPQNVVFNLATQIQTELGNSWDAMCQNFIDVVGDEIDAFDPELPGFNEVYDKAFDELNRYWDDILEIANEIFEETFVRFK